MRISRNDEKTVLVEIGPTVSVSVIHEYENS